MNVVNIVQAIEEWAQKDPERIAYREDDLTYTYGGNSGNSRTDRGLWRVRI